MLPLRRAAADFQTDAVRATLVVVVALVLFKAVEPLFSGASEHELTAARSLLDEARHLHALSLQDTSPQHRAHHLAVAGAYLTAARRLVTDAALERATGVDIHQLQRVLDREQRAAAVALAATCPS